ncbi:MAG TPA: hypothetical protein VLV50_16035 [Stellaceae bacterium]|nr:hypothetical protein [Stellaceae bacterium]
MAPLGEREGSALDPSVAAASGRLAAGDAAGALALLSPLIAGDAPSLAARFLLAHTAWQMGRLDWALELARACHEAAPMDSAAAETLASLYAQCGDPIESIYFGKLAMALGDRGELAPLMPKNFPRFDEAFHAIAEKPRLAKAKSELAAGKFGDALESARQHVAIDESDVAGRGFYVALLLRAGRPCDAAAALGQIEHEAQESAPLAALYAQSLTAAGDAPGARHWHAVATELAPEDPGIAAAHVADGTWIEEAPALTKLAETWAANHSAPARPRALSVPSGPLVIAYLVPALLDREDAAAIAAVASAHRGSAKTIAYASGAQSWTENAPLSGAFDVWKDVNELDPATIARYFRHDGVHAIIDAAGFASPATLVALSHCTTALRVSWLGNPGAIGAPIYDARITAYHAASGNEWGIDGGYPLAGVRHDVARVDRAVLQFGSDASLAQLDDATVSCWGALLRAEPEGRLLLRARDYGAATIDRLVARFGRENAARIDLVAAERFEEFYARVDVALAPRRGASPRMAAEALACGVPVVAFAGESAAEPYGSFLAGAGVASDMLGKDEAGYVSCALTQIRRPTLARVAVDAVDAAAFATEIEERVRHTLRQAA